VLSVRAGWQTYTSAALQVVLEYPAGWAAAEQRQVTTFTSPQGGRIQLQALQPGGENNIQDCNNLINTYGLSAATCFDADTLTYSAAFSQESNTGLTQAVLLSTTGQAVIDVYQGMLDSLHPVQ
jgi:hypothetical protein